MSPRSATSGSRDRTLGGRQRTAYELGVDALELDEPGAEEGQHDRDEDEPDAQSQHAARRARRRAWCGCSALVSLDSRRLRCWIATCSTIYGVATPSNGVTAPSAGCGSSCLVRLGVAPDSRASVVACSSPTVGRGGHLDDRRRGREDRRLDRRRRLQLDGVLPGGRASGRRWSCRSRGRGRPAPTGSTMPIFWASVATRCGLRSSSSSIRSVCSRAARVSACGLERRTPRTTPAAWRC